MTKIGDIDSMGHRVGWIGPDGLGWESEDECIVARAAGRYTDAWSAYKRSQGEIPNPLAYILEVPEHLRDEVAEQIDTFHLLRLMMRR